MSNLSEPLRVDPGTLHAGGTRVVVAADEARSAFAAKQERMRDAMVGWSPAARAAMEENLTSWDATHDRITTGVQGHGESLRAAAHDYSAQDTANADAVQTTALNLD